MCVISDIISLATNLISGVIEFSQSKAQNKVREYQIEQNKTEAKKAEMEAAYERQNGIESARRQKLSYILNMGNEKIKLAGANIALSSETVMNIDDDLKINSELDALTTQAQSEKKAKNLMDKSNSLYANAELINFNKKVNTLHSYAKLGNRVISSVGNAFGIVEKM